MVRPAIFRLQHPGRFRLRWHHRRSFRSGSDLAGDRQHARRPLTHSAMYEGMGQRQTAVLWWCSRAAFRDMTAGQDATLMMQPPVRRIAAPGACIQHAVEIDIDELFQLPAPCAQLRFGTLMRRC